jgi:hypothetical protein
VKEYELESERSVSENINQVKQLHIVDGVYADECHYTSYSDHVIRAVCALTNPLLRSGSIGTILAQAEAIDGIFIPIIRTYRETSMSTSPTDTRASGGKFSRLSECPHSVRLVPELSL